MSGPAGRVATAARERLAPHPAAGDRGERDRRRARRLHRAGLVLAVLVPVGLLAWVLLASPLLVVRTVEVTGTRQVPAQAVVAAVGVPRGTPLAQVDLGAVRSRVAALGPVASVRVSRGWPSTLQVRVTERTAVGSVQAADGTWLQVDGTGARYAPSAAAPPGLPQVQVGDQPADGVVQVLAGLPVGLRDLVATAAQPSTASVVLTLRDGRSVVWGAPGQEARKAAVVQALLARPGRVVDVSTPDLAVVR